MFLKKGSHAYSIFKMKCPRCQVGGLYETSTLSFKKSFYMPEKCPHCGQKYSLEPGFYYGAMFISYIFTGFSIFGFFALFKFLLGFDVFVSFILATIVLMSLFVWYFRISRAIWINFFIKYNKKYE
jgi:uncharacterized protein (DUF983 family)